MDVQDNTGRGDGETVRKVMTTFQMDADLKAELKRYCADNGMKMGETINQAIEQWLQTKWILGSISTNTARLFLSTWPRVRKAALYIAKNVFSLFNK